MISQHPHARKVAGIPRPRRSNHACKSDRRVAFASNPPVALLEIGHRRRIKKRQAMQFGQNVGDIVVVSIDCAYPIHPEDLVIHPALLR